MQHKINFFLKIYWLFLLGLLIGIFFIAAPNTVQELDCGELLTNTFNWRTIHPPGFPLYQIIYWPFLHTLPSISVVLKASALTLILAYILLLTLHKTLCSTNKPISIILPILLISWPTFSKYMLLPDVFMLHLLLVCLLLLVYLEEGNIRWRFFMGTVIFTVGMGNHHTMIFLLPLVIHLCIDYILAKESKSLFWGIVFFCIFLDLAIYMILFTTDSQSMTSWKPITSFGDWIRYILREQYGTFTLTPRNKGHFYPQIMYFVGRTLLPLLPVAFLLKPTFTLRIKILFLCFISYILIFFGLSSSLEPIGMGAEVLERFCLLPGIILVFFVVEFSKKSTVYKFKKGKIIYSLLFLFSMMQLALNISQQRKHNNNILEKWAIDRLQSIPENSKPTLILEDGDSALFALYYVKDILGIRPDLGIISPQLLVDDWYLQKIEKHFPVFTITRTRGKNSISLDDDIIATNISHFNFSVSRDFNDAKNFKLTFLKIGRLIEKGTGLDFWLSDSNYDFQSIANFDKIGWIGDFYVQYSFFYLAKGLDAYKKTNFLEALTLFKEAKRIAPFYFPIQYNICKVMQKLQHPELQDCIGITPSNE